MALSGSDGSAMVTKQEFDACISDLNRRLLSIQNSVISTISSQTGNYLDGMGINNRLLMIENQIKIIEEQLVIINNTLNSKKKINNDMIKVSYGTSRNPQGISKLGMSTTKRVAEVRVGGVRLAGVKGQAGVKSPLIKRSSHKKNSKVDA